MPDQEELQSRLVAVEQYAKAAHAALAAAEKQLELKASAQKAAEDLWRDAVFTLTCKLDSAKREIAALEARLRVARL